MGDAHGDYSRLAEVVSKLGLHEHLCVIYDTQEEQFAAALPYLRTSLERGEKCLYIVDENTAAAVLDALGKGGTDVDRYLRSDALTIANKEETYLEQGRFEPDWMISFLTEATAEAGAARFSRVRTILAEMTWALGTSNSTAKLIEYESKLNQFFRDHDARALCQYNRTRFSPELLLGVIHTHPLVVYGSMVCKNPYYVPPDEFLKPNEASQEVERFLQNILEWERTQQALRASEDYLRLVIDTVPALIHAGRADGYLDFFNQRWLDYVGLSLEEMSGWKWTSVIHPEDVATMVEKWSAAVATGEPFEHEARFRRADGEYRWMFHRQVTLRDDRGNVVRWYGSSIDIEDRKRAGEELRASEERWRAVFENSAVGIALTDPQGTYVGSNRAYQEMVGYSEEELRDMSYMDITFEEDREINRALASELWEGKRRQFQLEKRYRRKDGTSIWVRSTVSAAPGTQGKFRFGMAIVEDITERKRAEDALRRSEAYLAAGQGLSHTGSWAWNVSSGELFWSQETFSIFGFDPARTTPSINETFLPRIHPEDRPEVEAGLNASEIQKESYGADYRIVLPDGSIRYIHDVVYTVMNEAGSVVERYGVIMDVTERKRAEEIQAAQTVQAELRADVSTAFARETELGGILQRCTEAMVRHLDAAFARIWTLGKNSSVLELRASAGMYTHLDGPHGRLILGTFEIGHIAQERKPLFTNEVIDDPLISDRAWAKREGIVALAGYPLVVEGRVVGVMAMFARRALTPGTLDMLASVADIIAQGIERKQAEAELRSLTGRILSVEDEERRRLARELHDTTSQSLAALCMNLSVVSESAGVLNPRAQAAIAESAALADQCLREIRTVSYLLHPPELDEFGLQYALSRYIDGFIQRSGIRVEVEMAPDLGRLPQLIETTVFRIVQESLTNIHRHSGSDTAHVRLAKDPSNLVLEVEDTGDGIRAGAPSGVGITSMRERLQQVNGRLETISGPGGTVIRATIPLPAGI